MECPGIRRTGAAALLVLLLAGCLTENRAREVARDEAQSLVDTFRGTEVMPSLRDLQDSIEREASRREEADRQAQDLLTATGHTIEGAQQDLASTREELEDVREALIGIQESLAGRDDRLATLQSRTEALGSALAKLEHDLSMNLRHDLSTLAETLARIETRGLSPRAGADLPPPPSARSATATGSRADPGAR